jgi:hypothetical protein
VCCGADRQLSCPWSPDSSSQSWYMLILFFFRFSFSKNRKYFSRLPVIRLVWFHVLWSPLPSYARDSVALSPWCKAIQGCCVFLFLV